MKINYDSIIFSLQNAGGISTYWYELVIRLLKMKIDLTIYQSDNNNVMSQNLPKSFRVESSFIPAEILRYFPFAAKISNPSIFHSSYYRYCNQKNIANICTVYDFTYEHFFNGLKRHVHLYQKRRAMCNASGIICISENTKNDLLRLYPYIDPSIIQVIHCGVSHEFYNICSNELLSPRFINLKKPYLLYVGDRTGYKNFFVAIELLNKFSEFNLVVVGGKSWTSDEKKILHKYRDRIFHYQGVKLDDLNWLYNNAFAFIYPSSYEGFGIPVIEAMKAGCPVVAVNCSSIPEVGGNAALLVNEVDVDHFSFQLQRLLDKRFRSDIIVKGLTHSKQFSWDKCFTETMQFYGMVWNKTFGG